METLKYFSVFLICNVAIIVKGYHEKSNDGSLNVNDDIIRQLMTYNDLIKNLEEKIIHFEDEIKENSNEIDNLKSIINELQASRGSTPSYISNSTSTAITTTITSTITTKITTTKATTTQGADACT